MALRPSSFLALGIAASVAIGAAAVACSGSDGASTPIADPSGDGGGGGSSSGTPTTDEDGGALRADSGCVIKNTGPQAGTKVVSHAREGVTDGLPWETPDNAKTPDEMFAKVTIADGQTTEWLAVTGFPFTVPPKATVTGVVVELKRQAAAEGIKDGLIELTFDQGRTSGRPKYFEPNWPKVIVGTHNYGAPEDRWGNDVFPSDVNAPTFGVQIWAKRGDDAAGADPIGAVIDSLRIVVHYCE